MVASAATMPPVVPQDSPLVRGLRRQVEDLEKALAFAASDVRARVSRTRPEPREDANRATIRVRRVLADVALPDPRILLLARTLLGVGNRRRDAQSLAFELMSLDRDLNREKAVTMLVLADVPVATTRPHLRVRGGVPRLQAAVQRLPGRERRALLAHFLEGRPDVDDRRIKVAIVRLRLLCLARPSVEAVVLAVGGTLDVAALGAVVAFWASALDLTVAARALGTELRALDKSLSDAASCLRTSGTRAGKVYGRTIDASLRLLRNPQGETVMEDNNDTTTPSANEATEATAPTSQPRKKPGPKPSRKPDAAPATPEGADEGLLRSLLRQSPAKLRAVAAVLRMTKRVDR